MALPPDPVAHLRAAAAIDAAAVARSHAAAAAREGWEGPARHDFDDDLVAVQREATHLAADLRTAAASLDAAAEAARWATGGRGPR